MNRSLKEHKYYLTADLNRFKEGKPTLKDRILCNECWFIWRFLYHLRCLEYHFGKKGFHRLFYYWHWYRYKRYSWKNKWTIRPFVLGPGAHSYHIGEFVHIGDDCKVGSNFTFQPGVVLVKHAGIEIGDNVILCLGVKVIKSVKIGNGVVVGTNAVVTHDLPDNSIAAGIPAKIIRYKSFSE